MTWFEEHDGIVMDHTACYSLRAIRNRIKERTDMEKRLGFTVTKNIRIVGGEVTILREGKFLINAQPAKEPQK